MEPPTDPPAFGLSRREHILDELRRTGSVTAACAMVGTASGAAITAAVTTAASAILSLRGGF